MRARTTPTRLEIHRLKFHQNGRRGPLLHVYQLTDHEKEILNSEILQDVRVQRIDFTGDMDEQVFDEVQARVFAEWGVMCPHSALDLSDMLSHRDCPACGAVPLSGIGWKILLQMRMKDEI